MVEDNDPELIKVLLGVIPSDGASIGNQSLREDFLSAARKAKQKGAAKAFEALKEQLIEAGVLARGKGRGGSVRLIVQGQPHRVVSGEGQSKAQIANDGGFSLEAQVVPADALKPKPAQQHLSLAQVMAEKSRTKGKAADEDAQILSYRHPDKRKNNPQVGLVNEANDPQQPKTTWKYDPHIDPSLQFDVGRAQVEKLIDDALASGDEATMRAALEELKRADSPYLNWAGKAERTSFDIDTVSLHVHERIDPMSILAAVRKRMQDAKAGKGKGSNQPGLFDAPFENLPLRDAIDFYKHERGWANRLIAGDSLLVMNSLLQKESMPGRCR